jgi:protein gp37
MSDMFGQKVKAEWIDATLAMIRECPRHIFFSLTKNPSRLKHFSPFPGNLWVGMSSPPSFMFGKELSVQQQRVWFAKGLRELAKIDASVRWVSLEPLSIDLSDILLANREIINWAVIGAASDGPRTFQPDKLVLHNTLRALTCPVFFKGNLDRKLADEIAGRWREEFPPERD